MKIATDNNLQPMHGRQVRETDVMLHLVLPLVNVRASTHALWHWCTRSHAYACERVPVHACVCARRTLLSGDVKATLLTLKPGNRQKSLSVTNVLGQSVSMSVCGGYERWRVCVRAHVCVLVCVSLGFCVCVCIPTKVPNNNEV